VPETPAGDRRRGYPLGVDAFRFFPNRRAQELETSSKLLHVLRPRAARSAHFVPSETASGLAEAQTRDIS
jgi:hypothetical protein